MNVVLVDRDKVKAEVQKAKDLMGSQYDICQTTGRLIKQVLERLDLWEECNTFPRKS